MINPAIVGILFFSLILGYLRKDSFDYPKDTKWQIKLLEVWNNFVSYTIGGLIGYYFFIVRWEAILGGEKVTISDFGLILLLCLSFFGHLPVLSKNISEGIAAILKRVLESR
ncbi:MAG: hypothetical protein A2868_03350 [Candidatus Levybacteria bacterium RIFCSPHIGHO2_01_FULL_40_15b]|nr:MAG: hypothetical protein A2868_03350 [Candidatus Levybacteria bacterium RIFCSPHIGHO2_01_FULL_40_15b]